MTATIKEFCRINGIDETSADLADIIYEALIGGDNEIADRQHCSVETINRRIRSIKNKIADIVKG